MQFHPYRLHLEADPDGGFVATSPDVPELVTQGETQEESLANAHEAMLAALSGYMRQRRAFPVPVKAPSKNAVTIYLPEMVQAKILLYNAMVEEGITNSELSRRLGKKSENQVRRMLDPRTNVSFPDIVDAIKMLHMRLFIGVERTV